MSKNGLLSKDGGTVLGEMLKVNTLKELDVSSSGDGMPCGTSDGPGFAKELAVGIKGNVALSIVNVIGNSIGKEMLSKLQEIMRSKPNLVSLCGVADDATEADLSIWPWYGCC
jgi:hypothetical protein